MRVAALYDIHGNAPALESVLADVPGSGADLIVVGGEPMLHGVDEALVVSGHTHVQFDRVVAHRRLVNAGSVGMAYQGESGWAYWTMFGPTVEHRRGAFDADALATALRESGYPNPEWFEPESAEDAAADYEQMAQEH